MYAQQVEDFLEFMEEYSPYLLGLRVRNISPAVFATAVGGG